MEETQYYRTKIKRQKNKIRRKNNMIINNIHINNETINAIYVGLSYTKVFINDCNNEGGCGDF